VIARLILLSGTTIDRTSPRLRALPPPSPNARVSPSFFFSSSGEEGSPGPCAAAPTQICACDPPVLLLFGPARRGAESIAMDRILPALGDGGASCQRLTGPGQATLRSPTDRLIDNLSQHTNNTCLLLPLSLLSPFPFFFSLYLSFPFPSLHDTKRPSKRMLSLAMLVSARGRKPPTRSQVRNGLSNKKKRQKTRSVGLLRNLKKKLVWGNLASSTGGARSGSIASPCGAGHEPSIQDAPGCY